MGPEKVINPNLAAENFVAVGEVVAAVELGAEDEGVFTCGEFLVACTFDGKAFKANFAGAGDGDGGENTRPHVGLAEIADGAEIPGEPAAHQIGAGSGKSTPIVGTDGQGAGIRIVGNRRLLALRQNRGALGFGGIDLRRRSGSGWWCGGGNLSGRCLGLLFCNHRRGVGSTEGNG